MGLLEFEEYLLMDVEGKWVVVLGGGDMIMDCLWIFICFNVVSVICVYCCDEVSMLGLCKEVVNVCEEGVEF